LPSTRETELSQMLDAAQLRSCVDLLSRSGRIVESDIRGGSMGAAIPDGSRIRIRLTSEERFRPGQIVACMEKGFLFAHRVVHVRKDAIITQGDGWVLCDPPIRISQVLGEVVSCRVGEEWIAPASEANRSETASRAARRQVRLIAFCLRIHLRLARFVSRQIIHLHLFRKRRLQRFALAERPGAR
jgi:signal peptidase